MILTTKEINNIANQAKVHIGTVRPHAFAELYEVAVLAKLSQGVEMPEPWIIESSYAGVRLEVFTADQLRTCIAAARVQALEDAAKLVVDTKEWRGKGWTGMLCHDTKQAIAEAIRALKGTP